MVDKNNMYHKNLDDIMNNILYGWESQMPQLIEGLNNVLTSLSDNLTNNFPSFEYLYQSLIDSASQLSTMYNGFISEIAQVNFAPDNLISLAEYIQRINENELQEEVSLEENEFYILSRTDTVQNHQKLTKYDILMFIVALLSLIVPIAFEIRNSISQDQYQKEQLEISKQQLQLLQDESDTQREILEDIQTLMNKIMASDENDSE